MPEVTRLVISIRPSYFFLGGWLLPFCHKHL